MSRTYPQSDFAVSQISQAPLVRDVVRLREEVDQLKMEIQEVRASMMIPMRALEGSRQTGGD